MLDLTSIDGSDDNQAAIGELLCLFLKQARSFVLRRRRMVGLVTSKESICDDDC
jgi:hypothetical protein